ncbi:MAG: hypothetical protein M3434_11705, partial [Gemmatimonadota bacterium]|nr:hypothetical protein [Gemmatimonadota bacterium]
ATVAASPEGGEGAGVVVVVTAVAGESAVVGGAAAGVADASGAMAAATPTKGVAAAAGGAADATAIENRVGEPKIGSPIAFPFPTVQHCHTLAAILQPRIVHAQRPDVGIRVTLLHSRAHGSP